MITNKKWILKNRPEGLVKDSDFELITEELGEIQEGEILIKNEYLSFDPTQRMWLTDLPGYLPPVQIDDCLLYTSPSPRDRQKSRMPSSA